MDMQKAVDGIPAKFPRERLILLYIQASRCPHVFDRVLQLVTGAALIPVDVVLEYGTRSIVIEIQFDRARFKPSPWILEQIERIPSVRSADFLDHLRRPSMSAGEDGHSTIAGYSVDAAADRQSVVWGKSVYVSLDLGGRR